MATVTTERRASIRAAAAYSVTLCDRRGRFLARGRTVNISECGMYAMFSPLRSNTPPQQVQVQVSIPDCSATCRPGQAAFRTVIYHSRVTRWELIGQMIGLGIEFVRKLA